MPSGPIGMTRFLPASVLLSDDFVVFVTLDSEKECVAVIEFDSEIDSNYIVKDGHGDEYHTTITVFEPDVTRKGRPFDYQEFLVMKDTNYELEIKEESSETESASGEMLTTEPAKELSNDMVTRPEDKVKNESAESLDVTVDAKTEPAAPAVLKSERNYSYDALVSKPDMVVTEVGGNVPKNRADIVAMAKKNATTVGRFDPKTGSVSVHVDDIDTDVILSTKGLRHGLRRMGDPLSMPNYIVTVKAGEILKNSIQINEITPSDDNAKSSYILIGAARDVNGTYVVRFVVNHFDNNVVAMDVLYAVNAKKELAATKSPRLAAEPLSVTSSTISIAELLDLVNQHFPDILPEDVLKH